MKHWCDTKFTAAISFLNSFQLNNAQTKTIVSKSRKRKKLLTLKLIMTSNPMQVIEICQCNYSKPLDSIPSLGSAPSILLLMFAAVPRILEFSFGKFFSDDAHFWWFLRFVSSCFNPCWLQLNLLYTKPK